MITIEAIQTGLQVPVPKAWSFNSDGASAKETDAIKKLLAGSNFLHAPELPAKRSAPDRGNISILVTTPEGSRRLTFSPGDVPKEFQDLVRFVESRLEWRPRKP